MSVTKTTIYTINGQPIHVHEEGPPNGQVAILIHGWSSSWYAVLPLLPMMSQKYRCLAIDLPGFGDSPPLPRRVTISDYTELIAALIRAISPKPVVLVGHSMGGMTSITLSLRYPELVERMVLIGPTISGKLSMFINMFIAPLFLIERFVPRALVQLVEPIVDVDRLLRPSQFADRTEVNQEVVAHIRADARRLTQRRARAECFWAMRENDLRGQIGQIKTPTLIIWGLEDNCVPLRDASAVAREWPEADLRVIPNAGHWPQFETPQLVERYTRAFLNTPIKLLKFEL
jgi:pimeloyl-ACP methyl ester carboxylesterase